MGFNFSHHPVNSNYCILSCYTDPRYDENISDANSEHFRSCDFERDAFELPAVALPQRFHANAERATEHIAWDGHPVGVRQSPTGIRRLRAVWTHRDNVRHVGASFLVNRTRFLADHRRRCSCQSIS